MNIETEIRSFLSESQFNDLLDFFDCNANKIKEDYQETFYFDCPEDLRIQKSDSYSKIWMKKGKLHDDHREEIEIKSERSEFEKMEQLFLALGYRVEIKWFRKRHQFEWDDIKVCLDHTKGYGHIIELEKMCSEENKEQEFARLKDKLEGLGIELSPKEEFEEKYLYYKNNWRELIEPF